MRLKVSETLLAVWQLLSTSIDVEAFWSSQPISGLQLHMEADTKLSTDIRI